MKKIVHACFFTILFMSVSDLSAMYLLQVAMERMGIWDKQENQGQQDNIAIQDAKVPAKEDVHAPKESQDGKGAVDIKENSVQIDGEVIQRVESFLKPDDCKAPEGLVKALADLFGVATKGKELQCKGATPEIVAVVIKAKKIDVNTLKNNQGSRPLHLAASHGWDIVCRTLLLADAEVHCFNDRKAVPLGLAGIAGRTSTCKLLIRQYLQTDQEDKLDGFRQYNSITQAIKELASDQQKS